MSARKASPRVVFGGRGGNGKLEFAGSVIVGLEHVHPEMWESFEPEAGELSGGLRIVAGHGPPAKELVEHPGKGQQRRARVDGLSIQLDTPTFAPEIRPGLE